MKIIDFRDADFASELQKLYDRNGFPEAAAEAAAKIFADVKKRGDAAIIEYAARFDHVSLTPAKFRVSDAEIAEAEAAVSEENKEAIRFAYENIVDFARRRLPQDWSYSPREGVTLGEKFTPLDRVGVYVPGGTAPLVSTVLHTAGIARAAGVGRIAAVTPPRKNGEIHPETLFAMKTAGVDEIYRLGGVYGVAALAFGTATVKKVEKIVGPGNAYVTAAKRLAYGECAIDMVAGPSEIVVIADRTAPVEAVAADLLSQAEHGSGMEQSVLLTDDPSLPERVASEIERQKAKLSRREMIDKVLARGTCLILCRDMDEAAAIAGDYAPEHLEIMTAAPSAVAAKVRAAGAMFLGAWTPESAGDFCAGPSHVLPTAGSAKFFSGLRTEEFFRRSSIVEYTPEALARENKYIEAFGRMEGLDAHGRAGSARLEQRK